VTQRAKLEGGRQDGLQVLCLDVTSAASVEACVHELLRREGRIDVLVNNAGSDLFGAVLETQWHEFMDQLDTNFLARRAWSKPCCRACSSDGRGVSST